MKKFIELLVMLNGFVWDTNLKSFGIDTTNIPFIGGILNLPFIVLLILGAGIYLTFRFRFAQITLFSKGMKVLRRQNNDNEGISPLSALLLGTASRVGTGNIVGVAAAIGLGGPGAVFWMWLSAFFGMALAFSEATLAQLFKKEEGDDFVGGMPYYWTKILKNAFIGKVAAFMLIVVFVFWTAIQAFNMLDGIVLIKANITPKFESLTLYFSLITVIILTFIFASKGEKGVSRVTDKLVPIMALIYLGFIIITVALNYNLIPSFFSLVFSDAFSGNAVAGGVLGVVIQKGISRGLYSNEAGQGTTTMAAATANGNHPAEQGIVQLISVAIDTLVICTFTAFPIIISKSWVSHDFEGLALVNESFKILLVDHSILSNIALFVIPIALVLFAYTSILGLVLFSKINFYILSENKIAHTILLAVLCVGAIGFGGLLKIYGATISDIFSIADIASGILAICNIIVLIIAAPLVSQLLKSLNQSKDSKFNINELENFEDKDSYWQ